MDGLPLLAMEARASKQSFHLRRFATRPEGEQTAESHIRFRMAVVARDVTTPEAFELRAVRRRTDAFDDFLIGERR
jgi:hypothetical protein